MARRALYTGGRKIKATLIDGIHQLADRCFPAERLEYAVFSHRNEVSFSSNREDFCWRSALTYFCSEFIIYCEDFIDANSSFKSRISTFATALSLVQFEAASLHTSEGFHTDVAHHIADHFVFFW